MKNKKIIELWKKGKSLEDIRKTVHMTPSDIIKVLIEKFGDKYLNERWKRRKKYARRRI
jgi:hypothetical protein